MTNEPLDLAAVLAKITESSRGSEMAVRLQLSLEMTDGLWDLVPVVVAATEAHGQRPPAEVADSLWVARTLAPERRARLRELGDTLSEITATAVQHQTIDETAIEHLTAADITADPFGIVGRLMDIPAYLTDVLSRFGRPASSPSWQACHRRKAPTSLPIPRPRINFHVRRSCSGPSSQPRSAPSSRW